MIAALPMYDWAEIRPDWDAFWASVRDEARNLGLAAPDKLTRAEAISAAWADPDLMLGQTCGLPFVSGRCGAAKIVARPGYPANHAGGGRYASALVVRADDARDLEDFRGARAAVNGWDSQSGCNALADHLIDAGLAGPAAAPFFAAVHVTGAHRASGALVAEGGADLAAIDAVAWTLFRVLEPAHCARLRVLAWTRPMPGLPLIVGADHASERPRLLGALQAALAHAPRKPWLPDSVHPATAEDYAPIRAMAERVRGLRLAPEAPALNVPRATKR